MTDNLPSTEVAETDVALDADLELGFDLDLLRTDSGAEEDGRWFDKFMGDSMDLDIKCRSFQSQESRQTRLRLEAKYRRFMDTNGKYPERIEEKMVCEQLAEAIIVDWKGSDWKSKGQAVKFSKENALLVVASFKVIRNRVAQLAANLANFRTADQVMIEKN